MPRGIPGSGPKSKQVNRRSRHAIKVQNGLQNKKFNQALDSFAVASAILAQAERDHERARNELFKLAHPKVSAKRA